MKTRYLLMAGIIGMLLFPVLNLIAASTWLGTSGTNWHNASNWSGGIPDASTDIIIPSGLSNYPVLGADGICRTIALMENGSSISGTGMLSIENDACIVDVTGNAGISCPIDMPPSPYINITGTLTISGVVSNITNNWIKTGPGTLILTALNDFGGQSIIQTGTVSINTIENYHFSSSLGKPTTAPNGTIEFIGPGTLLYTGTGHTSNRLFNLYHNPATIEASGSGTLTLTGNVSVYYATEALPLILGGTSNGIENGVIGMLNGSVVKNGSGTWTLGGNNTYGGSTTINAGILYNGAVNVIPDRPMVLNGGTYSTGASSGFSEIIGTLALTENSTIALGTGSHTLSFAASNTVSWTAGKMLTVTGWSGNWDGTAGTTGKIFFGINSNGLTAAQIAQIRFYNGSINVPATLLSTGELVPSTASYASDYFRTQSSGNWSVPGNWQSSHDNSSWITASTAPTNAATLITIQPGHNITIDMASTAGNLVIDGTLNGGSSTLNITGNWTNNNTFIASTSTIIFDGSNALQLINGSSSTDFYYLKIDKGQQDRVLEAISIIGLTAPNDPLIITSGTFKLSSASVITPFTGSYNIPATGGFWNNGGTVTTGNSVTLFETALLRSSAGSMKIGSSTNSIKYGNGSTVIIEGGTVIVPGRYVPSGTNPVTNYIQSGGEMILATESTSTGTAVFDMQTAGSSFTMSGGAIIIQKPLSTTADFLNFAGTHNVTGGTIQFGNTATSGSPAFSIRSTVPVWDLIINPEGTPSLKLVTNGLTVKHNLTISPGTTFNFNNEELWLQGDFVNDGITTGASGYLSFTGTTTQHILGSAQTWLKNLRMNNSAGLDISGTPLPVNITGTLYLLNGVITTGPNYIDMLQYTDVSRTSGHICGNLQKFIFEGTGTYAFEIGGPAISDYTPVSVTINNVYNIGMLMATTITGDHPNIGSAAQLIPNQSVNRYWKLTNSYVEFTDYSAIFNWQAADEDDGFDFPTAICGRYSGSSWSYPTVGTRTATSVQITGATAFNDFQVAGPCSVAKTPVFTGGATSGRLQGATISTYTATSPNSTSMSYMLDASSLAAGNTINASTGQVSWTAAWTGTSTITATATGCNGSSSANHTVSTISTAGNLLYGLTRKGGSEDLGTVFHYNLNTGTQTVDYSAATVNTGSSPFWTALTDGGNGKFYGVTRYGGVNNKGVLFEWDPSSNIYTKKYEFDTATGSEPQGSLILSGGKLYGLTYNGGTNNMGTIFEYNLSTNTYTRKYSFEQLAGKFPFGSLSAYDNKFFGTTTMGGAYDHGVIFEWDPTNNNYTKKIDLLSASTGAYPYASDLILYNGKFYGTTEVGGVNGKGTIFEWNPATNIFTKKIDLVQDDGANPFGSLTLKDGKFYGMTKYGGSTSGGVIYEWDPATNAYVKKYTFSAATGWLPYGALTLSNGKFYGLTYEGGANNFGALFEWDPSANSYTKKVDFLPAIGSSPIGSMIMKDGILYGMTITGGMLDKGVIFKYDPAANTYQKKIDFSLSNGSGEMGSLAQYNGKFYGMTPAGGVNNMGTIFELDPATGIYTKKFDLDQANGSVSYSTLAFWNGKFYGMTASGGANNVGVIFEWDPATNVYVKKFDFSEATGKYPRGALTLYAGKFYGLAAGGGNTNAGVIFEWDPSNNNYTKKIDMVLAQGSNPEGSLTFYNGNFYGTTSSGGANGIGTIFEWNPSSNSYNLEYSLAVADGAGPKSTLALYNDKLYGLTMNGGANLYGTIFLWDPVANTFTKKIDLVQATGGNPYGSLFLGNNNKFYGMTNIGGTSDLGVIFEWDPVTNVYSRKTDFTGTANGSGPYFTHFAALVAPTISINPENASVCIGTEAVFTATSSNAGTNPSYQWKVNGNDAGTNSSSFTYMPANNDQVQCVLLPGSGCPVCDAVTSNSIVITVSPVSEGGTATASDPMIIPGTTTTITLTGYTGSVQWQQSPDGSTGWTNVTGGSGATAAVYTTANLTETTWFRAMVTSGFCSADMSSTTQVAVGQAPSFTSCPGNMTVNVAPGTCSREVNYSATASGLPSPTLTYVLSGATTGSGSGSGSGVILEKGETTVTVTATNGVLPDATCSFKVTVLDHEGPVISCPGNQEVTAACSSDLYTVTGTGFDLLSYSDLCSGISSVTNDYNNSNTLAGAVFTIGQHTIIWTVADNSTPPNVTTCSFVISVNMAEKYSISGTLKYNNAAKTPMNNVTLTLSNGVTSTTNSLGQYSFGGLCDGAYTISITNNPKVAGSINATDAAQVNYWSVSPYSIEYVRFLAGDVYGNEFAPNYEINSTDAYHIQLRFVNGPANTFPRDSWSYWKAGTLVNANGNFGNINVNISGTNVSQNLYGQSTGDFNGSYIWSPLKSMMSGITLVYDEPVLVEKNTEVTILVRLVEAADLTAASMVFVLPDGLVDILDVTMKDIPGRLDWTVYGDELRIGWNSVVPQSFAAGEELVSIRLRTTDNFISGSTVRMELTPDPVNELADGSFGTIPDAQLQISTLEASSTGLENGTGNTEHGTWNISCSPNPFKDYTMLSYSLPADGHVTLVINDMLGHRVTLLVDEMQSAGEYTLKVDDISLLPGMYMATLTCGEFVKTIKLIREK